MVGSTIFLKIKERKERNCFMAIKMDIIRLHFQRNLVSRISVAQPHWTPSPPLTILMLMESTNERQSIGGHKTNILPNHIPKPSHSLDHQQQSHPSTADHGHPSVSGDGLFIHHSASPVNTSSGGHMFGNPAIVNAPHVFGDPGLQNSTRQSWGTTSLG